jgi:hypothetical protein
MRDDALVYVEQIPIGVRIRDIGVARDGRVVLWSDQGDLIFVEPAEAR